jgi:hypothetical protein
MGPPEHQKESPESLAEEFGAAESRRYPSGSIVTAKQRKALSMKYLSRPMLKVKRSCISGCPSAGTTAFRHYHRQSEVAWRQFA